MSQPKNHAGVISVLKELRSFFFWEFMAYGDAERKREESALCRVIHHLDQTISKFTEHPQKWVWESNDNPRR